MKPMGSRINIPGLRRGIEHFDFTKLFVGELGWSHPHTRKKLSLSWSGGESPYSHVAQLGGVAVLRFDAPGENVPGKKQREKIHRKVQSIHHEHLLIFVNRGQTVSLWSWLKREQGGKSLVKDHLHMKGQSGDLLIGKLSRLHFDISDFDPAGDVSVAEVARRLQDALDVERVTKRFYADFNREQLDFIGRIEGIENDGDRRWYASVLLNRLMFIWFLQKKGFVNGDLQYLQNKLEESRRRGAGRYYAEFLQLLFFQGFARPPQERDSMARELLGDIRYLNGGLFIRHLIEERNPEIKVPDAAFANLFALFDKYSWHLDDAPGGADDEINPDVLGYILEKYINNKEFGAYYTRPEITGYLCEQAIHPLILERVNGGRGAVPELGIRGRTFHSLPELLMNLDAGLCRRLIMDGGVLQKLSVLDPACGSGAFLVAAMKTLINIYAAVIGRIEVLRDNTLNQWLAQFRKDHPNILYGIKKRIISDNLFGVDVMEEAGEICKLRLFLALVASAGREEELEPLPNIDFNIVHGNSLVGLLRVEDGEFAEKRKQPDFFLKSYHQVVQKHERDVETYRRTTAYAENLQALRDGIEKIRRNTNAVLRDILLGKFVAVDNSGRAKKIQFEQAAWDVARGRPGKARKRDLREEDISALRPFHWGFIFNEILNRRGGFDIILTNPPWETFKPDGKEFFEFHSELVAKKKMTIKAFEKHRADLMRDPEIRAAWLEYMSRYPHQSKWFRAAEQYRRQFSAAVNGKKVGSDINLYKLFLEQCHNLLCAGGECGIVIPSGIYTDLGAKGLRQMLFTEAKIGGLFGFENRRKIFENVDGRFKFVVLTFRKGGATKKFPAALMRHDVKELADFPERGAVPVSVELVRKLSPDSLSVMEFKSDADRRIIEKMSRFPLLGERIKDAWSVRFHREFDMTGDSHLFRTEDAPGRLPLYEGKMIHQFNHRFAPDKLKYWIDEGEGRAKILGRTEDTGQKLDYQDFRFGVRSIAGNTNERTLIAGPVPGNVFCGNSILVAQTALETNPPSGVDMLVVQALLNSYVVDYFLRMKVTTNINMFYLNQLPIPRLTESHPAFRPIAERAARLVCTTKEFDPLAKQAGLKNHTQSARSPEHRHPLRAELDALVAGVYGLTEAEFAHILNTFPAVAEEVKIATFEAFQAADGKPIK